MKTEIVGDEVEIRGYCGVGRLRVRDGLTLEDPNVNMVSAGNLVAGSLEVTGNEVVKGNLTVEGASGVSVDEDLSVGGNASVSGDLTVTGDASVVGILTAPKFRLEHAMFGTTYQNTFSSGDYVRWITTQSNTGIASYNDGDRSVTLSAGKYYVNVTVSIYTYGTSAFGGDMSVSIEKNGTFLISSYTSGDTFTRATLNLQEIVESSGTDKIKIGASYSFATGSLSAISDRTRLYIQRIA